MQEFDSDPSYSGEIFVKRGVQDRGYVDGSWAGACCAQAALDRVNDIYPAIDGGRWSSMSSMPCKLQSSSGQVDINARSVDLVRGSKSRHIEAMIQAIEVYHAPANMSDIHCNESQ